MAQRVPKDELIRSLAREIAFWSAQGFQIGLYQNDYTPGLEAVIAEIVPCTWGGYDGLRPFANWTAPVWETPRAVSTADPVVWTANGIGAAQNVYGSYVVDGFGQLVRARRRPEGPVLMGVAAQTYTVSPKFSRRSEL